jgi:hypothetical protein
MTGQSDRSFPKHPRCRRSHRTYVFLAAFAAALAAAVLGASPALPDTTQTSIVQINVTDTVSGVCPFDIAEHQAGSFKVTDFFAQNGSIVKTILTPINGTFVTTWSANGVTATSHGTPVVIIDYNSDTTANVGVILDFVVPGSGVVFAQTGRLVFGEQGITFQAGQNQLVGGDTAALCEALA